MRIRFVSETAYGRSMRRAPREASGAELGRPSSDGVSAQPLPAGCRPSPWGKQWARAGVRWGRCSYSKKSAFPAKAGTHSSTAPSSGQWIPAFAGNADFQLAKPSLDALDIGLSLLVL